MGIHSLGVQNPVHKGFSPIYATSDISSWQQSSYKLEVFPFRSQYHVLRYSCSLNFKSCLHFYCTVVSKFCKKEKKIICRTFFWCEIHIILLISVKWCFLEVFPLQYQYCVWVIHSEYKWIFSNGHTECLKIEWHGTGEIQQVWSGPLSLCFMDNSWARSYGLLLY